MYRFCSVWTREVEEYSDRLLGRTGMPEDIGLIAAFLASEEARWLTGEIVFGSGGLR